MITELPHHIFVLTLQIYLHKGRKRFIDESTQHSTRSKSDIKTTANFDRVQTRISHSKMTQLPSKFSTHVASNLPKTSDQRVQHDTSHTNAPENHTLEHVVSKNVYDANSSDCERKHFSPLSSVSGTLQQRFLKSRKICPICSLARL